MPDFAGGTPLTWAREHGVDTPDSRLRTSQPGRRRGFERRYFEDWLACDE
jgi:hypothetical protein